ncbi:UDP-Gal betaGal beta 1,3-galactosyltransferase, polypeptide 6 [Quaeritorhiza haematococci]|nr:UDP-Gal betaGal beta 1,3-galactosyltransferase, polypeptide 6 [Quaeritorhiza haematococci]
MLREEMESTELRPLGMAAATTEPQQRRSRSPSRPRTSNMSDSSVSDSQFSESYSYPDTSSWTNRKNNGGQFCGVRQEGTVTKLAVLGLVSIVAVLAYFLIMESGEVPVAELSGIPADLDISPHHWNKTIESPPSPPEPDIPHYELVIGILSGSAPKYLERRVNIRDIFKQMPTTYVTCQDGVELRKTVQLSFIYKFVLAHSPEYIHAIQKESDEYGDILVMDTADDYDNLYGRVLWFYQWAHRSNFSYTWLLKTDDDSFVRVNGLISYLRQLNIRKRLQMGRWYYGQYKPCWYGGIRWGYPIGLGYVTSEDLVRFICENPFPYEMDPFGRPEDAGMGMIFASIETHMLEEIARFHDNGNGVGYFGKDPSASSLVVHHLQANQIQDLAGRFRILDTKGCVAGRDEAKLGWD